jgi:hypothetical protein
VNPGRKKIASGRGPVRLEAGGVTCRLAAQHGRALPIHFAKGKFRVLINIAAFHSTVFE